VLSAYDSSLRRRGVPFVVMVPLIRNGSAAGLTRPCHSATVAGCQRAYPHFSGSQRSSTA
jgi:hypothetical protein